MSNNSIAENIAKVKERVFRACERSQRSPGEVKIVAVTKGVGAEKIKEAYSVGLREFGESYVQEAAQKIPQLSIPITWHFVGHLQSNKAKLAVRLFSYFHSLDSLKLARRLSELASSPIPVLLQVNVAGETSKFGLPLKEVPHMVEEIARLPKLQLRGLMTIAPIASDPEEVRWVFRRLRELGDALGLRELSMGMSGDYEVAIEEGATIIRLGRAIFGERR